MNYSHMQLVTTSTTDAGVLHRVKTALTPMTLDAKLDQVTSVADRIALEVAGYKQRVADIEWDAKNYANLNLSNLLRKKQSCRFSLARVKLHVETALHKRAIEVLKSTDETSTRWKDRLRRDLIYRTLFSQAKWLRAVLSHVKAIPTSQMRRESADEVLQTAVAPDQKLRRLSLDECNQQALHFSSLTHLLSSTPPTATPTDEPCKSYLAFELFLTASLFHKTDLGMAFESHCCSSLASLSSTTSFHTLVGQVSRALADEHDVPLSQEQTLRRLVRQMVYARLGAAFITPMAASLELDQVAWKSTVTARARSRALKHLPEVGLPASSGWFTRSITALEAMPTFMPDRIVDGFMKVMTTLHEDVAGTLGQPAASMSADVILPVLVALVLHCDLPCLHLQTYAMETLALTNGCDGGEAAYYVALLQAAMVHSK
ncbi:hypothetical protein DYB32_003876 [Aphanomyces invadans]|uniref:VPS9 domain-containing protein n=1 Tax=Aphanomyces invadans TaxID=157072 RepID=A0A3R6VYV9_9STRA|nr:hypothetical protein DYB32_003876 [Aphanomyces invadans]